MNNGQIPLAKKSFRVDFLDSPRWDELASARGLRLPRWSVAPTRGKTQVWLKKLGISHTAFCEWAGVKDLSEFGKLNPEWGLRALVGLLLETQAKKGGIL